MLQIVLPTTNIRASVLIGEDSIACAHVIHKATLVATSIRVSRRSSALSLVGNPIALVPNVGVGPSVLAIPVLLVHHPLSLISVGALTSVDCHFTLTVALVIGPPSCVHRFIAVHHCSETIFFAFGPLSIELVASRGPSQLTTPTHLVIDKSADVN